MSRRKRSRARFKGPVFGVKPPEKKTDRAPPPDPNEYLKRSLRDLVGEMREQVTGATMGASLLRQRDAYPEAARFLEGLATGLDTMINRVKCALDADECPF
jgi:hypothetical protein